MWLKPPPDASLLSSCSVADPRPVFHAVSPRYLPVTRLALRLVPPTESTSGSEAGRFTSLIGVKVPVGHGSLTAPRSPDEATTVTWCCCAPIRTECKLATSLRLKQCSPQAPLREITAPCAMPI